MTATIHYQCQRCTACCRWPGFVRITEAEIPRIAAYLGLDEAHFIQHFTRLMPKRDGLALLERPNGECFYFKDGGCLLQAVKPEQCVGFPNTWNFPGWEETCKAIPVHLQPASKNAKKAKENLELRDSGKRPDEESADFADERRFF